MSYCRTLSDRQLRNVLLLENERKERGGEIGEAARELYHEAREECARRQMDPDLILLES
jgi:hypothetical protein